MRLSADDSVWCVLRVNGKERERGMRSASGDTSGRVISVMAAVWDVLSESDTAERAEWGVREEHNECNDSHQVRRDGEKTRCKIKRVRDWVWCMRKTRQREIESSSWTLFGFGFANSESLSMVKALLFTPDREIASSNWKEIHSVSHRSHITTWSLSLPCKINVRLYIICVKGYISMEILVKL